MWIGLFLFYEIYDTKLKNIYGNIKCLFIIVIIKVKFFKIIGFDNGSIIRIIIYEFIVCFFLLFRFFGFIYIIYYRFLLYKRKNEFGSYKVWFNYFFSYLILD